MNFLRYFLILLILLILIAFLFFKCYHLNIKKDKPIGETECSPNYPADLKRKSKLLSALCHPKLYPFNLEDIQTALFANKIKKQDLKEELFQLCKKIAYSKTTSINKISKGLQHSDFLDYD